MAGFGVYLHVPFCASKCEYCAFATWTDRHHLIERYVAGLEADLRRWIDSTLEPVTSVFVGGGTPSLLDPGDLGRIVSTIPCEPGAEVTVECNPDDVTAEMMRIYAAAGVNRISLGVQSMVDHVLAGLGRQHRQANVAPAVDHIRSAGIASVNLDLIYGAVSESVEDWSETIGAALALEPDHISAYALTVEAGTPLARTPDRHPDDDDQAVKYELADRAFEAAGLHNYEISNWSLADAECRHNRLYWAQGDYLGIGCAAHSHRRGRRWWNLRTPERYLEAVESGADLEAGSEELDAETIRLEGLQLALRMREGVGMDAFDDDDAAMLAEAGLIEDRNRSWVLTRRGRLMANSVAMHLR
jgi:putative oxygen-independent coproporphyrinogen III oxidase